MTQQLNICISLPERPKFSFQHPCQATPIFTTACNSNSRGYIAFNVWGTDTHETCTYVHMIKNKSLKRNLITLICPRHLFLRLFKTIYIGATEMAQQITDLGSVPSTHPQITAVCNSSSRGSDTITSPPQAPGMCVWHVRQTDRYTHTHTRPCMQSGRMTSASLKQISAAGDWPWLYLHFLQSECGNLKDTCLPKSDSW